MNQTAGVKGNIPPTGQGQGKKKFRKHFSQCNSHVKFKTVWHLQFKVKGYG